jgi:hypothetical protein
MAAVPSGCTCGPFTIAQQLDAGELTDAVIERLGQAAAAAAPPLTRNSALFVSVLPEWDAPGREQARARRGRGCMRPGVREGGPGAPRQLRRQARAAAAPDPSVATSGCSGCSQACAAARCRRQTLLGG